MTALTWPARCRRSLAETALAEMPKLLTLLDRTPHSATFGCFDRAYWHYRTMDFPCGMSQEYVLPLALAFALDIPGSPYHGQPELRRWVEAGIRFAARAAHADGSCDDYYPFERAAGAAAFSLFACLEAARLLGLEQDGEIAAFLSRRSGWLAGHEESGRLANHEALIVACLVRMAERDGRWEQPLRRRLARLLSWQSDEGWFTEYEGADQGYLSLTIGLLAEVDRRRPDLALRGPIARAVTFLDAFVHPDGSVGGGYASRGTVSFFPHGLEIAGAWLPEALLLNERALRPLIERRQPCFSDDHIIGHHLWNWLLAWSEWRDRPAPAPTPAPSTARTALYPLARQLIEARGRTSLYCGWSRGGAFRLYEGERLLRSDTGPSLRLRGGRVAVAQAGTGIALERSTEDFRISGRMGWAKGARLTPARSILLRLFMLTVGRCCPGLARRALQALLVTGRRGAPFRFERRFRWTGDGWSVTDRIMPDAGWRKVTAAGVGGFQSAITTVMARLWQPEQFQPWEDWSDRLAALGAAEPLVVTRILRAEGGGA